MVLGLGLGVDDRLHEWLREDIGRGDWSTIGLGAAVGETTRTASWVAKAEGVVAGLPFGIRCFELLGPVIAEQLIEEGGRCRSGDVILRVTGPLAVLLTGERTALNVGMRLSGIATATRGMVDRIGELPTRFVDTRKTTPGLRLFEKYGTRMGGGQNHRMGLDDAVMIKDNHIAAAGGIGAAIGQMRRAIPYPLAIEVETESLAQVAEAAAAGADLIMLDNMGLELMAEAVGLIRGVSDRIKIEASGNVDLDRIRDIALTGVDYISSSGPMTRAPWLDISMRIEGGLEESLAR
jgi:nicotinate-nucleotide pyrophosphorylase (carboxylating)